MAHTEPLSGGERKGDPVALGVGELQTAENAWYKPQDQRIWNQKGPLSFGTASGAIKWMGLALFDDGGTDRLLAYSGTVLESATPGTRGTYSTLISGLNAAAEVASMVHDLDRWYWGNGYDRNRVIESSGSTYNMGMDSPDELPVGTPGTGGGTASPSATEIANSGFSNFANARDGSASTFAHATLLAAATSTATWGTWGASAASNRRLQYIWRLAGFMQTVEGGSTGGAGGGGAGYGVGGGFSSGYDVTVKMEVSQDGGTSFTTLYNARRTAAMGQSVKSQVALTANSDQIQFRATLTYNGGTTQASLQIYEVTIETGSQGSNVTTSTGLIYGVAEFDSTRGRPSPVGPVSARVTLASQNQVSLTLPSAAKNATTDTWLIYRTTDGGDAPQTMGLIGSVPVTDTVFIDDLVTWPKDEQALPLYALYETSDGSGTIRVPQDSPPPALRHMANFKGRIVGVSRDQPRALRGSVAGIPESWPETSVILSFPWSENDRLVATVQVGEILLIAAEGLMMTLSEWPETVSGVWNAARVEPLRGAPGCVGQYALESFSVSGEPRAAWVSPFGIHVTNGVESFRISDDMDWENEVAQENLGSSQLFFDKSRQVLVFSFNNRATADAEVGSSDNDKEVWFHLATEHRKANGLPKMTRATRATNHMTQGLISGVHRIYSGDPDGETYLWEGGTGLAAVVRTRRMAADIDMAHVPRAFLRHSDFGPGSTATVLWEARREQSGGAQIDSRVVALSDQRRTTFYVGRAGDTHECQITTPAGKIGALLDLIVDADNIGEAAGAAA